MSVKPQPPNLLWREVPLFIIFLFISVGIVMVHQWDAGAVVWLIPCFVSIPIAILCTKMRYARYRVIATVVMSIGTGSVLYASYEYKLDEKIKVSSRSGLTTQVKYSHISKAGNTVAYVEPVGTKHGSRIMVIVSQPQKAINEGDTLLLNQAPAPIESPQYGFEFDQAAYYKSIGITHRTFLRPEDVIHKPNKRTLIARADGLRKLLINKLQQYITNTNSGAVLYAMLLGDKTELNSDIKEIYSSSGAMHVLAISGLHIGIIASILLLITGNPSRTLRPSLAFIKVIVLLVIMWSYIWLVGMPPSACRAGGMFSLYIAGSILRRRSHPLNILGSTGIIALFISPQLIFNVGFQLSYLALIGILTIGLPLYRSLHFKLRVFQYIWGTIAISIGAQFLLIPLLAYYFNEVSTMSALSSLFAIPAAYVIIGGGILLIITLYIIPPLAVIFGHLLSSLIALLTNLLENLGSQAWSTISRVYLTGTEMTVLLILLICICARITTGNTLWLKATLPLALAFMVIHSITYCTVVQRPAITFYRTSGGPALELIHLGRSYAFGLDSLGKFTKQASDKNRLSHYVRSYMKIHPTPQTNVVPEIKIDFHSQSKSSHLRSADYHIYNKLPYRQRPAINMGSVISLNSGPFQIQLK